jgi:hypothetical protein
VNDISRDLIASGDYNPNGKASKTRSEIRQTPNPPPTNSPPFASLSRSVFCSARQAEDLVHLCDLQIMTPA